MTKGDLLKIGCILLGSFVIGCILSLVRAEKPFARDGRGSVSTAYLGEPPGHSIFTHEAIGLVPLSDLRHSVEFRDGIVIDARPSVFYKLGHIPGSVNLEAGDFKRSFDVFRRTKKLDFGAAIIVYCSDQSCSDSTTVCAKLAQLGFIRAKIFPGGWAEWTAAGMSAESIKQ